jgi:hypothetical protein
MKAIVSTILACVLASPMMADTTNGIVYKVRLANGGDQYYQIVVPRNLAPAQIKPRTWATPSMATDSLSAQAAGIAAVAWSGGVSKSGKGGPPNSPVDVGGHKTGGFYNASNVRIDSVELKNDPVPYYLVRMTGQVGETRQILYAAVLKDGRLVRPVPIGNPLGRKQARHHQLMH